MGSTKLLRRLTAAAAAVLAVAAVSPASVAAVPPTTAATAGHHDPAPGGGAMDKAAATAVDVAIIAETFGWTQEATRRHMQDQEAFGALLDEVVARFQSTLAGAEHAETPGGRSWIRFKGEVPAAARELASASGLDVGLTGGRKFSATELTERAVAVVRLLADAGHGPISAEVSPGGEIEAATNGPRRPGAVLPPALREGVNLRFVEQPVAGDLHGYGGAKVRNTSTGFRCTSGFSVEHRVTGETGVTTAAHCDGMNRYEQPWSTFTEIEFPFREQHIGGLGEVEWHATVDHDDLAEYYADGSSADRREVNSVETGTAVNNLYCLYSHVGGNRICDRVRSTSVVMFTTGLAWTLIGMDDYNAQGGDSGGPWSYQTEAVGTVVGWYWAPFGNHDAWSPAWLFDSALDLDVLVQ
jgi:streptogrisin C